MPSFTVVGVKIADDIKDFKLFEMVAQYSQAQFTSNEISSTSHASGLTKILRILDIQPTVDHRYVVIYDPACSNKEEYIKALLNQINRVKVCDELPILISIGPDESPLSEEIKGQVSVIKTTHYPSNAALLKQIVTDELVDLANHRRPVASQPEPIPARVSHTVNVEYSARKKTISMMVLSGFIAAIGIAAVAVAFTLSLLSLGIAGALLGALGAGLFARYAYKASQETAEPSNINVVTA